MDGVSFTGVVPSVSITHGTLYAGTSSTFTATPTNGGDSPSYQWQLNGSNVGTNSNTYSAIVSVNDIVRVTLTSNHPCASPTTALASETITSLAAAPATGLDLDGTNDYVNCGDIDAMDGQSKLTMEVWVKFNALTPFGRILTKESASNAGGSGWGINTRGVGDELFLFARNGSAGAAYTGSILTTNTWTHIAYVFDGTGATNQDKLKCYMNGVEQALTYLNNTIPATTPSDITNLLIGADANLGTFHNMVIDEVRIWNTARTEAEIQGRMNCELTGNETGLIAYYNFNQAAPNGNNSGNNTPTDNSGNGNTGTLNNFQLSGNNSNWVDGVSLTGAVVPSVSITHGTLYAGTSSTFTANPTNGGASPSYQWQLNGSNVGTNSNTYSAIVSVNDIVSVTLTSNEPCASPTTALASETITLLEVLPVELTYFKGSIINKQTLLIWQTTSEINNSGFEVERSSNGIDFEQIGYVEGKGTTLEVSNYQFIDEKPINGVNYYRLKQLDFDGKYEYSKIVTITIGEQFDKAIQIFPNPVSDQLTIIDGQGQAKIYNTLGQLIQQFQILNKEYQLRTNKLVTGQYILQIARANGTIKTVRFIKR